MKTTIEFLAAVKEKHHLHSDGRLAAQLGITRSAISTLMGKKNYLGDETAMKVADLLELDPAYVVACVHAERAKAAEEKTMWERIAARIAECDHLPEKISLAAVLAVLAILLPGMEPDSLSAPTLLAGFTPSQLILYIMLNDAWLLLSLVILAAAAFPWHYPCPQKEADKLSG